MLWLRLLDVAFFAFHTVLVLFNLLGWVWRPTRRWNLITLGVTACSWFVMGLWYGIGYCICTDWHWQVRRELGYGDDAQTYIQLLLQLAGIELSLTSVERLTAAGFVFALTMSIALNIRDSRRPKTAPQSV